MLHIKLKVFNLNKVAQVNNYTISQNVAFEKIQPILPPVKWAISSMLLLLLLYTTVFKRTLYCFIIV